MPSLQIRVLAASKRLSYYPIVGLGFGLFGLRGIASKSPRLRLFDGRSDQVGFAGAVAPCSVSVPSSCASSQPPPRPCLGSLQPAQISMSSFLIGLGGVYCLLGARRPVLHVDLGGGKLLAGNLQVGWYAAKSPCLACPPRWTCGIPLVCEGSGRADSSTSCLPNIFVVVVPGGAAVATATAVGGHGGGWLAQLWEADRRPESLQLVAATEKGGPLSVPRAVMCLLNWLDAVNAEEQWKQYAACAALGTVAFLPLVSSPGEASRVVAPCSSPRVACRGLVAAVWPSARSQCSPLWCPAAGPPPQMEKIERVSATMGHFQSLAIQVACPAACLA